MYKSFPLGFSAAYLLSRLVVREVKGQENLPPAGNAGILVCNHQSLIDGILLCAITTRYSLTFTHPLTIAEPFANPLFGWFLRTGQAIPVDRKKNPARALQLALAYLQRNEVVTIFPEGHVNRGRHLRLARPGAALLALETGTPIYPCGICGSAEVFSIEKKWAFPRHTVGIYYGEPLATLPYHEQYHHADRKTRHQLIADLSLLIMRRIADLCGCPPHRRQ